MSMFDVSFVSMFTFHDFMYMFMASMSFEILLFVNLYTCMQLNYNYIDSTST